MDYRIAEKVTHRTLEHEVVVLNLSNGLYYVLNETASLAWESLFVKAKSLPDTVSTIAARYQVDDPQAVERDVTEQLDYWMAESLITHAGEQPEKGAA